jgi:hypothetical protein
MIYTSANAHNSYGTPQEEPVYPFAEGEAAQAAHEAAAAYAASPEGQAQAFQVEAYRLAQDLAAKKPAEISGMPKRLPLRLVRRHRTEEVTFGPELLAEQNRNNEKYHLGIPEEFDSDIVPNKKVGEDGVVVDAVRKFRRKRKDETQHVGAHRAGKSRGTAHPRRKPEEGGRHARPRFAGLKPALAGAADRLRGVARDGRVRTAAVAMGFVALAAGLGIMKAESADHAPHRDNATISSEENFAKAQAPQSTESFTQAPPTTIPQQAPQNMAEYVVLPPYDASGNGTLWNEAEKLAGPNATPPQVVVEALQLEHLNNLTPDQANHLPLGYRLRVR